MTPSEILSKITNLIESALAEDTGPGDRTTQALFKEPVKARARIVAREDLMVAGLWMVPEIFRRLDPAVETQCLAAEGQRARPEALLAQLTGDGRSLLTGERVALNFLQRLCGVATLTARYVDAVQGTRVVLLDTRKTTPGWRLLEKYAVRMGGAQNHRMDLSDGILIKDNHIALAGSLKNAVLNAKRQAPGIKIEVEVSRGDQVDEALAAGADILLLDNMTTVEIQEAVKRVRGRALTEASGGVTLGNVREMALTGVDFISIGALTHSADSVNINMDLSAIG
jgi:nicotinate-nucleotide pyrophosphorylase (carboxylating)